MGATWRSFAETVQSQRSFLSFLCRSGIIGFSRAPLPSLDVKSLSIIVLRRKWIVFPNSLLIFAYFCSLSFACICCFSTRVYPVRISSVVFWLLHVSHAVFYLGAFQYVHLLFCAFCFPPSQDPCALLYEERCVCCHLFLISCNAFRVESRNFRGGVAAFPARFPDLLLTFS